MKFTHLIISKINIKWLPQSYDEVWLEKRIKLFNETLRPSIVGQTNKNFKFVTLWGYEPQDVIDNEYPIMIDAEGASRIYDEMIPKLRELIDEEYVLTTRVDSDNALGETFVETLHNAITTNVPYYYDIKSMDMYDRRSGLKKHWIKNKTSGFISAMERTEDFICIPNSGNHGTLGNLYNGMSFDNDVLLTVHGDNHCVKHTIGHPSGFSLKKYNVKF